MKITILDAFFKKPKKKEVNQCSKCRIEIPKDVAGCWNCGQILNENIRKLIKEDNLIA
jgi:hypothetical protein